MQRRRRTDEFGNLIPVWCVREVLEEPLHEMVRIDRGLGRALLVAPKLEPTPDGFPRRPGAARKRPLA